MESFLVDYFESKKFLIDTIIVACSIPLLTCNYNGQKYNNANYCDGLICKNQYKFIIINPNYDLRIPIQIYYWTNDVNKNIKLYNFGQTYQIKNNTNYIICVVYLRIFIKMIFLFFRILISIIKDMFGY